MKRIIRALTATAMATGSLIGVGLAASAPAHAETYPCGFTGIPTPGLGGSKPPWEEANYNHCASKGNVIIRVQYTYAERDMCVTPGNTRLYSNSNLGALKFAYYVRAC